MASLNSLRALEIRRIAEKLVVQSQWKEVVKCFEEQTSLELLKAQHRFDTCDLDLCEIFLKKLAELDVAIDKLINALNFVGLNSIAEYVKKENYKESDAKQPGYMNNLLVIPKTQPSLSRAAEAVLKSADHELVGMFQKHKLWLRTQEDPNQSQQYLLQMEGEATATCISKLCQALKFISPDSLLVLLATEEKDSRYYPDLKEATAQVSNEKEKKLIDAIYRLLKKMFTHVSDQIYLGIPTTDDLAENTEFIVRMVAPSKVVQRAMYLCFDFEKNGFDSDENSLKIQQAITKNCSLDTVVHWTGKSMAFVSGPPLLPVLLEAKKKAVESSLRKAGVALRAVQELDQTSVRKLQKQVKSDTLRIELSKLGRNMKINNVIPCGKLYVS